MTLERWKRATEWPLAGAAAVFLLAYAWSVLGNLQAGAEAVAEAVMLVIWALFVLDYAVSLLLAKPRRRWFVRHLLDLAIVLLPVLRPLRLLRLVTLLSVLHRTAGSVIRGRVMLYVVVGSALLILVSGLAILDVEQNAPNANITTATDAFWWAFVTITTVGYGDFYPVTFLGRLIAAGTMIAGIGLIATVTGTLASWIVEQVAKSTAASERASKDAGSAI